MQGTVSRWFVQNFGFITPDACHGIKDDIFVHRHAIPQDMESLEPGTRVLFEIENDAFGRRRAKRPVVPIAGTSE